jgi:DNA-binding NtrC family response regulator
MPQKVLVVDDDYSTRDLLTTILTTAGYEAVSVGTLNGAFQMITEDEPDAVIADVRLEGYNGLQLAALTPRPIPIIMVTGYSDPALEQQARQMGADYLLKPVQPQTLLDVLRRRLGDAPSPEASRRLPS